MPLPPLRLLRPLLYSALLLLAPAGFAAPGELDFSFNGGQAVRTNLGGVQDFGEVVEVLPDGRVVVAGSVITSAYRLAVARYKSDGQLDPTFNGTGIRVQDALSVAGYSDTFGGMAVQSDGKIVVVGSRVASVNGSNLPSSFTIALVRYTSSGALDTSFGGTGVVTTNTVRAGFNAVVQTDGKIVVTARLLNGTYALVRYTSAGALDPSFNGTGILSDLPLQFTTGGGLIVQSDGTIVAAGGSTGGFVLVRSTGSGVLDTSFNGTGVVTIPADGTTFFNQTAADDGKIVLAGFTLLAPERYAVAVRRFTSSGELDTSFNGTGVVTMPIEGESASANGVVVQGNGQVVVCGGVSKNTNSTRSDGFVMRLNADSALDTTFGEGGFTRISSDGPLTLLKDVALQSDGRITAVGLTQFANDTDFVVARLFGGESMVQPPEPQVDTTDTVPGEPAGTTFSEFSAPAVDSGVVGGLAKLSTPGAPPQGVIYAGDGAVQARTGGLDPVGAQFTEVGDPAFAGEALGFAGTALLPAATTGLPLRLDARLGTERMFAVRPGGRLAALYSQLTQAAGIKRLAAQADPAPGGGQFAKFGGFGLPRTRGGLVFTGSLHRSNGVTKANDYGVWRERAGGGDSDLLLRNGSPVTLAGGGTRDLKKVTLMTPVANATDQRRSFAPDGGVAAMASFADGSSGVVQVAPDGSVAVALETSSAVPDEAGNAVAGAEFRAFNPPATVSGGQIALLANLRAAAQGLPPPSQAIFSSMGGSMRRIVARGDAVAGRAGVRFGALGQPVLGQRGMVGFIAALTGRQVTPANRTAIAMNENGIRLVVARLGEQAVGMGGRATYRRFMSMVVTDSDPARLLFTATVGGPGVKAADNAGLWSVSPASGSNLILRKGQTIMVGGQPLTVRTFEALQAPRKSMGQGRSTDADGFVTAKVKLSDGRQGVLRIPLP